jgi:D-sedoheptulose 7-phosphate isomerase
MGLSTIAFTGKGESKMAAIADYTLHVSSGSVPRIQEIHITAGHAICEMVDYKLFKKPIS